MMSHQRFRFPSSTTPSLVSPVLSAIGSSEDFESIEDQAELLLSISDIARSEIKAHPSILDDEDDERDSSFPPFPSFGGTEVKLASLTPRTQPIRDILFPSLSSNNNDHNNNKSKRLRSVSIDLVPKRRATLHHNRHTNARSPTPMSGTTTHQHQPMVAIVSPPTRKRATTARSLRSARLSHKTRRSYSEDLTIPKEEEEEEQAITHQREAPNNDTKSLQGKPPKGVLITKIRRRKFSWKNYPELEEFLVANRDEYLRHSALNYTLQQKQYNNRLTDRLLEIATAHGYMFDTHDFGFVTVRDRIRCYYKSYVQSAKKRGVLMGYAARKAGLLTEQELMRGGEQGTIVVPGEEDQDEDDGVM